MRKRHVYRPVLEGSLEERLVLSYGTVVGAVSTAATVQQLNLVGAIQGTTTTALNMLPDVGKQVTVHGSGRVTPLGHVKISGTFLEPGFIAVGKETATLVLTNAKGSVTLDLERPFIAGSTSTPAFEFTIVKGTKAFRLAKGSGTAQIAWGGPIGKTHAGSAMASGSFLLALNEPLPPVALPA